MDNRIARKIRSEIAKATGIPFEDSHTAVIRSCALTNSQFAKLSEDTRAYLNAMSRRIRQQQTIFTPEEYLKQLEISQAPTELPLPTSERRQGRATNYEIASALLSSKGIIPSSYEMRTTYGLSKSIASSLRANLIFVLRVLSDLGLYKHQNLKDSIRYAHLRRKPQTKAEKADKP